MDSLHNEYVEYENTPVSNFSEIQQFFYAQCIFLTGITGLVGKALLEKILRCCPGIGTVYVLIRPKRNLSAQERLEKLLNNLLFESVAKVFPDYRKKVQAIEGDITKPGLGISFEGLQKIRQNVSIVFHCAANINLMDPLKNVVENNVVPAIHMMEFGHQLPHLKVLVHLSTLYVKREPDGIVLEEIPKLRVTPFQLIEAIEWMDEKCIKAVSDLLVKESYTSYMLSKALAEGVVSEKRGNLPVAIVRPGYICPTYKDPIVGWSDALQGMTGLSIAASKGVLRTIRSKPEVKFNVIPLDYVINTIIASAWHTGLEKPSSLFIINCTLDPEKQPVFDTQIFPSLSKYLHKYPFVNILRYPNLTIYSSKFLYYIHAAIDQYLPAIIIDFFLFLFTGRTILMKIYYKMHVILNMMLEVGTKLPYISRCENYKMLQKKLSEKDSKIFFMEVDDIDWDTYIGASIKSSRYFLAHEDVSTIPYAKRKAYIWWVVTTILKWIIILYFFYYLFGRSFSETELEEKMLKVEV